MSDTSPRDQASLLWNAKGRPARQPRPGELLFEFRRDVDHFACELRDHGEFGVEAQFLLNGHLFYARTFRELPELGMTARQLAVAWADQERRALDTGGA